MESPSSSTAEEDFGDDADTCIIRECTNLGKHFRPRKDQQAGLSPLIEGKKEYHLCSAHRCKYKRTGRKRCLNVVESGHNPRRECAKHINERAETNLKASQSRSHKRSESASPPVPSLYLFSVRPPPPFPVPTIDGYLVTFCYSLATAEEKRPLWAIIPKVSDSPPDELTGLLRKSYAGERVEPRVKVVQPGEWKDAISEIYDSAHLVAIIIRAKEPPLTSFADALPPLFSAQQIEGLLGSAVKEEALAGEKQTEVHEVWGLPGGVDTDVKRFYVRVIEENVASELRPGDILKALDELNIMAHQLVVSTPGSLVTKFAPTAIKITVLAGSRLWFIKHDDQPLELVYTGPGDVLAVGPGDISSYTIEPTVISIEHIFRPDVISHPKSPFPETDSTIDEMLITLLYCLVVFQPKPAAARIGDASPEEEAEKADADREFRQALLKYLREQQHELEAGEDSQGTTSTRSSDDDDPVLVAIRSTMRPALARLEDKKTMHDTVE